MYNTVLNIVIYYEWCSSIRKKQRTAHTPSCRCGWWRAGGCMLAACTMVGGGYCMVHHSMKGKNNQKEERSYKYSISK